MGGNNAIGRHIVENAYQRCLEAGLDITGMNSEVAPSQWEIQVCAKNVDAGDQLQLLRYILKRTSELFECDISIHPKPYQGDWNGSGCHANFSTADMRGENGYDAILEAVKNLETSHKEHIDLYGVDNDKRLTGLHETASLDTFSWGVANRGASVRIPTDVFKDKKGYLEDRRPSSNVDPYNVIYLMIKNTVLVNK